MKDYELLVNIEATMNKHMPGSTFVKQVSEKVKQGKAMKEEAEAYE